MTACAKCGKCGDMHFLEQYFFCRDHWREVYELVLEAQKIATKDMIENYIAYKTQEEIEDAANLFREINNK